MTQLQEGQSLAAVAEAQGVPLETLVDGLVAAAEEHEAEHVEAGEIPQEQTDERLADVEERISTLVEQEGLPMRGGHGPGGRGDGVAPDGTTDGTQTPAPSDDATTETTALTA